MEKRINIINELSQIDKTKLTQDSVLEKEYLLILKDIENQAEKSINTIINNSGSQLYKFISGGSLAWLIALFFPFMKTFKSKGSKFAGFFLCLAIGGLLGLIAMLIPTIISPWVNYIGFNIMLIILLVIGATMKKT